MLIDLSCPAEIFRAELPTEEVPAASLLMFNLSDRIIASAEVTLRLLAVIALPWLPYDKVIALATLTITISAVRFLMFFVYAKKKTLPQSLPVGRGVYTSEAESNYTPPLEGQGEVPSLLRQMLSFSGWNVLGTFSQVLKGWISCSMVAVLPIR